MARALLIAAALGLLLPDVAMAQNNQNPPGRSPPAAQPVRPQPARPGPPGRPTNQPARPMPQRPGRPVPQVPGRPMGYRPGPTFVRPLPPRGNQFWHRGQYFGRISGPAFAYPRGWRYRQWSIGQRLPPVLFGPSFVFQGWGPLGLQAPVYGYAWVRFGPDLLLINQSTGEVEDAVYGVFL